MQQPVGLGPVAERAGVSKATASRVFNNKAQVSARTRERVVEAAAQLGYVPRETHAAGAEHSGPRVWVAFDELANFYATVVLEGLLQGAAESTAEVVLSMWKHAPGGSAPRAGSPEWIRYAAERGAAAVILVTSPVGRPHRDVAAETGLPLVVIDPFSHVPAGTMTVGATNWRGGVQATEHLLGLGHTRIAFVGAPEVSRPGEERQAGFRRAMEAAGVPIDPKLIVSGTFQYHDGLHAATRLLATPNRPTAIFAGCDAVALGVFEAAHRAGLRIPEDLSVIGFDNSLAAQCATPQLTTINQPIAEMGRLAMRTALAAVTGEMVDPPMELATTLITRGSTGPAPSNVIPREHDAPSHTT